jgi:hypothetical protein
MTDVQFLAPSAPEGVEPAAHYRDLLVAARTAAFDRIERLHLDSHPCVRDAAADASTALRELRRGAQLAVEGELDDEELLLALLVPFTSAIEEADRVIHVADLRFALEHDVDVWEQVEPDALRIGEWAMSGYLDLHFHQVRDMDRLLDVDSRGSVPLVHARMRAIVAGMLHGRAVPLASDQLEYRFDELLIKTLQAMGPVPPDSPVADQCFAGIGACALWNLARIAQRDDMSASDRSAHLAARGVQLDEIRADVDVQRRELGAIPDFDYWFDVGVAYVSIEPILSRLVAEQDLRMPGRPHPLAWLDMLGRAGAA